nr:LysR family transcriptional regulator [Hyphomonas sp. Mor2]
MTHNSTLLDGMVIFATVVEAGAFGAAGKRLGHSASHISKSVAALEQRLGVRLLNRTTRSVSLTDDGRAYYERCRIILDVAEEATSVAEQRHAQPTGRLRLTAPVSFGLSHLSEILPKFMDRYPDVTLDVELNDRMVDLVAEGFDLAIRVGDLGPSSLISTRLARTRGVIVAAPSYWDQHGRPETPVDLKRHACISYSNLDTPNKWTFATPSGEIETVTVPVNALCNSAELETALAAAGRGVTRLPAFTCKRELAAGELEIVLEDYENAPIGIFAVYPHRAHLSIKVRAMVDFLKLELSDTAE